MTKPRRVFPALLGLVLFAWIALSFSPGLGVLGRSGTAAAADPVPPAAPEYEMFILPHADGYESIRWNKQTGESWWTNNLSAEWAKCGEAGTAPSGSYVVSGAAWKQNDKATFALIRFEQTTGQTWYLSNHSWKALVDPLPPGKK